MTDPAPSDVRATYQSWPAPAMQQAWQVRTILLDTAPAIGSAPVVESLKWGEPALRPRRGGTTLRIAWSPRQPDDIGLFVDCKTDLCQRMSGDFPQAFSYAPPRAMYLPVAGDLPKDALRHLARIAFRYKRVIPA